MGKLKIIGLITDEVNIYGNISNIDEVGIDNVNKVALLDFHNLDMNIYHKIQASLNDELLGNVKPLYNNYMNIITDDLYLDINKLVDNEQRLGHIDNFITISKEQFKLKYDNSILIFLINPLCKEHLDYIANVSDLVIIGREIDSNYYDKLKDHTFFDFKHNNKNLKAFLDKWINELFNNNKNI